MLGRGWVEGFGGPCSMAPQLPGSMKVLWVRLFMFYKGYLGGLVGLEFGAWGQDLGFRVPEASP